MVLNGTSTEKTYFDQQRELLVQEVSASLENVLQNMNKLNRSLEGVIAVGNEFSQVEGLWSQFENVMAKPQETDRPQPSDGKDNIQKDQPQQ